MITLLTNTEALCLMKLSAKIWFAWVRRVSKEADWLSFILTRIFFYCFNFKGFVSKFIWIIIYAARIMQSSSNELSTLVSGMV